MAKKKSTPPPEPLPPQAQPLRNRVKEFRLIRAGDIEGAPWNWRSHSDEQKATLQGSIDELGFIDPLDVREMADGKVQLFDGHARRDLVDRQIGPDTLVPCSVTDLTEEEAKKANVLKDTIANMAGVDKERLEALLAEVHTDNGAIAKLFQDLATEHGINIGGNNGMDVDPDQVPEPPDEAITQPGDLWILGNHRLLCGDSSKSEDVDRLLDGAVIHLVNTDPPYNVKVEPRSNNAIAAGLSSFAGTTPHQKFDVERHPEKSKATTKKLRAKDRPLANDFVSDQQFDRLLQAWFGNLSRLLVPGRGFYIWGGYANCANYPPVLKASGLYFSQAIIWVKEHPVLTRKDFMGNHEWCLYGWKEGAAHQFYGPNNATDVWSVKKVNPQSMIHLTEKPVELATRAMEYSSRPGENVLDLFGGSGSTLIGAEKTGRNAFLMELDQLYCDVIVERWQQFTGQTAERQTV